MAKKQEPKVCDSKVIPEGQQQQLQQQQPQQQQPQQEERQQSSFSSLFLSAFILIKAWPTIKTSLE